MRFNLNVSNRRVCLLHWSRKLRMVEFLIRQLQKANKSILIRLVPNTENTKTYRSNTKYVVYSILEKSRFRKYFRKSCHFEIKSVKQFKMRHNDILR